jgi:hypothetical protein
LLFQGRFRLCDQGGDILTKEDERRWTSSKIQCLIMIAVDAHSQVFRSALGQNSGSIRVFCRVRPLISTINQGLTTNCRKELMVNSVSYPRLFKNCSLMLQKTVHLHTLSISMLEVYLGNLRDLLVPRQPLFRQRLHHRKVRPQVHL